MSQSAIQVEALGKRYRLGTPGPATDPLREALSAAVARVWRRPPRSAGAALDAGREGEADHIWALRDVSFRVAPGEIVGVVGRNGAGKSTLLRILSRITEPTRGRALVRGRLRSLLEVGTGFHPDLTGRENIHLNGALLGMTRREIRAKFDEIVAFAEIERFLDTPVKRYSSGMYVRLAFAVAAHLDSEILLVDEVLAVGDALFQEKCLGKIRSAGEAGRTVLFVSHNLAAVEHLCSRAILLERGRLACDGGVGDTLRAYARLRGGGGGAHNLRHRGDRGGRGPVRVVGFAVEDDEGREVDVVRSGQPVTLALTFETTGPPPRRVVASVVVRNALGVSLIHHRSDFTGRLFDRLPPRGTLRCRLPRLPLGAGVYSVTTALMHGPEMLDHLIDAAALTVAPGDFYGSGHAGLPEHTPFLVDGDWSLTPATPPRDVAEPSACPCGAAPA